MVLLFSTKPINFWFDNGLSVQHKMCTMCELVWGPHVDPNDTLNCKLIIYKPFYSRPQSSTTIENLNINIIQCIHVTCIYICIFFKPNSHIKPGVSLNFV
jgi:hypothetical protein